MTAPSSSTSNIGCAPPTASSTWSIRSICVKGAMQPPKLFDRGLNQLIEDGQALAQIYTPDWTAFADPRDAGHGLIELGARLVELLVDRVNRVPEKNLLAFLDLVGL